MELDAQKLLKQLDEILSGPPFQVRIKLKVYRDKIADHLKQHERTTEK